MTAANPSPATVGPFLAGVPVIYPSQDVGDGRLFRAKFNPETPDKPPHLEVWEVGRPIQLWIAAMNEVGARTFFMNLEQVELQQ